MILALGMLMLFCIDLVPLPQCLGTFGQFFVDMRKILYPSVQESFGSAPTKHLPNSPDAPQHTNVPMYQREPTIPNPNSSKGSSKGHIAMVGELQLKDRPQRGPEVGGGDQGG